MKRILLLVTLLISVGCGRNDNGYGDSSTTGNSGDTATEAPSDLPASCEATEGKWKTFPSACTDRCEVTKPDLCATVLTEDCDCGPNRCFHEGSCIKNPPWHHSQNSDSTPVTTPTPTATPNPEIF
jgi:hypothetical protein